MEVTEQSVVSQENYEEIKNMLTSNDAGSKKVALTILEQSDYNKSEIYILCMLKEVESVFSELSFEEEYKQLSNKITKRLESEGTDISQLSFRKLYEIAIARDKPEELEFMLNTCKEELIKFLKEFGFTFLDYLEISFKQKETI